MDRMLVKTERSLQKVGKSMSWITSYIKQQLILLIPKRCPNVNQY